MATVTVQPLTLERGEYWQTTSIQSSLLEGTLSFGAIGFSDFCVVGLGSWAFDVLVMLPSRFGLCPSSMMMMMNRTCSVIQDPSVCVIITGYVFGLFLIKHKALILYMLKATIRIFFISSLFHFTEDSTTSPCAKLNLNRSCFIGYTSIK